jgi:hypothetical protein
MQVNINISKSGFMYRQVEFSEFINYLYMIKYCMNEVVFLCKTTLFHFFLAHMYVSLAFDQKNTFQPTITKIPKTLKWYKLLNFLCPYIGSITIYKGVKNVKNYRY